MLKHTLMGATLFAALTLGACGTTPGERGLSGAGLGAIGGAAIGSVTGSAGTGAVIGGVAGGAIGALTSPDDVYLGEPIWKKRCYERRRNGERVDCSRPPPRR
jgi:osmotically inducible lipoprotein OsmB